MNSDGISHSNPLIPMPWVVNLRWRGKEPLRATARLPHDTQKSSSNRRIKLHINHDFHKSTNSMGHGFNSKLLEKARGYCNFCWFHSSVESHPPNIKHPHVEWSQRCRFMPDSPWFLLARKSSIYRWFSQLQTPFTVDVLVMFDYRRVYLI